MKKGMGILDIPPDVLQHVFDQLHINNVLRFMVTCKGAMAVGSTWHKWRDMHKEHELPMIKAKARKIRTSFDVCRKNMCHVCFQRKTSRYRSICGLCNTRNTQMILYNRYMLNSLREFQALQRTLWQLTHQKDNVTYRFSHYKSVVNRLQSTFPPGFT